MTTFLYSVTTSADGYITDPDGDMSWLQPFLGGAPDPIFEKVIPRISALLMGRTTYDGDDPHAGDPEKEGAFEGHWEGPQVVLTHRSIAPAPAGFTVAHTLEDAVDAAREAAGPDGVVNVLGADVARQCLQAGVLDEVIISTVPLLLGNGTPLLRDATEPIRLELLAETPSAHSADGTHTHHYRVVR